MQYLYFKQTVWSKVRSLGAPGDFIITNTVLIYSRNLLKNLKSVKILIVTLDFNLSGLTQYITYILS